VTNVWKTWKCRGFYREMSGISLKVREEIFYGKVPNVRNGILTAVREMSEILLKVRGKILSGKSGQKTFIFSCIFGYLEASS